MMSASDEQNGNKIDFFIAWQQSLYYNKLCADQGR